MTGGADALGVDQSTVSRRIAYLERKLDVKLFERHPTGYVLTSVGEALFHHAQRMDDELITMERYVVGQDRRLSGTIRVSTSAHLAAGLLALPLVAFAERFPDVEMNLLITNDLVNMSKHEADVIIRITQSPPETLVGRKVADVSAALYATKEYWRSSMKKSRKGVKENGYRWISNAWPGETSDARVRKHLPQTRPPAARPTAQVNEVVAMKELIKAGLGVGRLPCFMGDTDRSLQRVSSVFPSVGWGLWILTHEDLRWTTRVKVFTDFIADALGTQKDLLKGCLEVR